MPYWDFLRSKHQVRRCLIGINACVVGLLIATFIDPVVVSTLDFASDYVLVIFASIVVLIFKFPQWLSVLVIGVGGLSLNIIF